MEKLNFKDKIYIEFNEWLDIYDIAYIKEYEKWEQQKKNWYLKGEEFEKEYEKATNKLWLFWKNENIYL